MLTRQITVSRKKAPCPKCRRECQKHSTASRKIHDLGTNEPVVIEAIHTKHFCPVCRKHFSVQVPGVDAGSRYTQRVKELAVSLVRKNEMTFRTAAAVLQKQYWVRVPPTTIHDWRVDADQQPQDEETNDAPSSPPGAAGA